VLRATWNYFSHHVAFLAWAERCAAATPLWNPVTVIRWNSHKGYLHELAAAGLPVVPTRLYRRGSQVALAEAAGAWPRVVIKPAISAGSFCTTVVGRQDVVRGQAFLDAALAERDMMVQPYFSSVETHGERSLVWIDGAFSHEVRKSARFTGDQERVTPAVEIGRDERAVAERVLAAAPGPLLYARVDLARDDAGTPHLMELELIEPSLFFLAHPPAADRLAAAIAARL
jgi:glutathione synthase/RimK-type ligase-like ATP-grasp enzyme